VSETATIKGLDELAKFLSELPVKVEKNIMRGALRSGMNVVKESAKANAPVGEPSSYGRRYYKGYAGALRDSIRVGSTARGGRVTGTVKAGGKTKNGSDAFYAHMIEYGTQAHLIKGRKGGMLTINGKKYRQVMHPGTAPRAFMRPALDSNITAAVVAAGNYVKSRLATKQGLDTSHIMVEGDE